MSKSPILVIMEHAVTKYDRRRAKRSDYNEYALAQYLAACDHAYGIYNQGNTLQRAIDCAFNDRLRDVVLKAVHAAGY